MYLLYLPFSFLIRSSSGLATVSMPIMAPLAQFAGVPSYLVVTAYQAANGLVNLVTPTSAVVMGGIRDRPGGLRRLVEVRAGGTVIVDASQYPGAGSGDSSRLGPYRSDSGIRNTESHHQTPRHQDHSEFYLCELRAFEPLW